MAVWKEDLQVIGFGHQKMAKIGAWLQKKPGGLPDVRRQQYLSKVKCGYWEVLLLIITEGKTAC